MEANVIHLVTREQRDLISRLLQGLGYARDEAFFLVNLKMISGRTRIRTASEAEAAIDLLLRILADRKANAAIEPETGGRGRAA